MADDFKKLSKDFGKLNKAMESLQASSDAQLKEQKKAINSVSDPMNQNQSGSDPQAKALAKVQEKQSEALSKLVGYQLGTSPKKQKKALAKKEKLENIDRKAAIKRTSSLGIIAELMKKGSGDKKKEESKLDKIRKERKKKREEFYKEARSNGKTAKQALSEARRREGIQNKTGEYKIKLQESALRRSKTYRKMMLKKMDKSEKKQSLATRFMTRLSMTEEEKAEIKRDKAEKHKALLDGLGLMSDELGNEIRDTKEKKTSFISKIFGWLKKGAMLAAIGALLGDWIGSWLGDKIDGVFGENSWLGSLVRDNGWWIGIGALLALPFIPALTGALLPLGLKLLTPLIAPLLGMVTPLLAALAPIAAIGALLGGAAFLGWIAGDALYKNLVGPWIDEFYARKQQEEAMFDSSEVGQSKITLEGGGEENAYVLSEELAAKYKDLTGGGLIAGETVARKIAEKEGMEGGLEGAVESGDSGLRAATFRKESSTGSMISGTETFSAESAKKESEEMKGRSQLHDMSAAGKSGINISITSPETGEETIKHVSQKEGEYAKIKFDLLKVGEMVRAADNLVANVIGKGVYDDASLDLTEQGLEKELEGYRRKTIPRIQGINRGLKKLPEGDPLIADVINAYERLKRHMAPTSWSIMDGYRNEYVDEAGSTKTLGIYGEGDNFYSKGGAGGYLNYKKSPTFPLKGLFSDPLWDALPGPTELASGGLVTKPIHALVGEAGPEAVIPLDRAAGVIGSALSKALQSPSMLALASQRNALNAVNDSTGTPSATKTNVNIVNNQSSSNHMNFTPSATSPSGPTWIKTLCDH